MTAISLTPAAGDLSRESMTSVDIRVIEPGRMNLLGLMLASLLRRRLGDAAAQRCARALRGDVLFAASGMRVTLRFEPGRITLTREPAVRPRAQIQGTLTAFLQAALGRSRFRSVLTGQLRISGNPLVLWRVLGLVRA